MKNGHVKGEKKDEAFLYALSTCIWCKKTKQLLDDLKVEYSYIFVDQLEGEEKEKTKNELRKWNPRTSFPTIVIKNEICIVGYKPDEIKKALKK